MNFLIRWLICAVAVAAAVWFVPGLSITSPDSMIVGLVVFSLVFALVNTIVKPIAKILSLPITVLTLGIFYLILNALMLMLAAYLSQAVFGYGLVIADFLSAVVGAIVISIVTSILNAIFDK